MKKQSAGFYLTVVSAVAAIVGLIAYLVNCNTNYFKNLGVLLPKQKHSFELHIFHQLYS